MSHHEKCHNKYAIDQSGVFQVTSVTSTIPTDNVTGITLVKKSGDGTVGNTIVSGPTQISTTNQYIYTINIPITFEKSFKYIPAIATGINSQSGSIYAPGIGVVNSVIQVSDATKDGFIFRIHTILTDYSTLPLVAPQGVNILLHQLLQPTGRDAISISYIAQK